MPTALRSLQIALLFTVVHIGVFHNSRMSSLSVFVMMCVAYWSIFRTFSTNSESFSIRFPKSYSVFIFIGPIIPAIYSMLVANSLVDSGVPESGVLRYLFLVLLSPESDESIRSIVQGMSIDKQKTLWTVFFTAQSIKLYIAGVHLIVIAYSLAVQFLSIRGCVKRDIRNFLSDSSEHVQRFNTNRSFPSSRAAIIGIVLVPFFFVCALMGVEEYWVKSSGVPLLRFNVTDIRKVAEAVTDCRLDFPVKFDPCTFGDAHVFFLTFYSCIMGTALLLVAMNVGIVKSVHRIRATQGLSDKAE